MDKKRRAQHTQNGGRKKMLEMRLTHQAIHHSHLGQDKGKLPDLGGILFRYTMYRDLPLENAVYWSWYVRNIDETGCPGEWRHDDYIYYYWSNQDYVFISRDIARYIEEGSIQVALGVVDMCQYWYLQYANCEHHTPSPWYDNVRIQRYDVCGPQWSSRDLDLF